ncbi:MAG: HIT family protein [Planctomycetota bacterium]|nr:HIT family protein [Planctomycetota bacterium]
MSDCLFCKIVQGKVEATFVYRDDLVSVFMDTQPINPGHLLIIPNRHSTYLADLSPETGMHLFRIAQQMAQAIRRSGIPCEGVNFFLADGEVASQEILHVHLHVFPRTKNDGFGLKFGEAYFVKPPRVKLEVAAEKIRKIVKQAAPAERS